ncbi:hypothetical protein AZE42_02836 [Rhizopogon vesiculosus]|uniref:DUF6533 domain-containing protein n=1 Tax=Rhizopogon vesiculosus TaxID=180088 RepID=A0A1J8PHN4_9AGAM|nr:hypothetical protein AZE42_02836 [Rhizopogon vesiculosus]
MTYSEGQNTSNGCHHKLFITTGLTYFEVHRLHPHVIFLPPPLMESIDSWATAQTRSRDLAVASAALIIYDHIITFDQEVIVVTLFWGGSRDASRVLYLSVSYVLIHTSPSSP